MTAARELHRGRLLGVLLVGAFMPLVDETVANVATPSIQADLGASGAVLQLVIGGYLIAFALLLIPSARLGQTHGYRRIFLLGTVIFTLASLLCGLAPTSAVLVTARVLQGAGAALMFPQTLSGIQLNFAGKERTRAIGLYAIMLSAGAVLGQIVGGALISANIGGSEWRAIFLINVPIGIGVVLAALRYLPPDQQRTAQRVDLPAIAALSATILLLVPPLSLGREAGWPPWTWICLAASVPAFLTFIVIERRLLARGGSPLVNVHVVARGPVLWALLTLLTATSTYYAILFVLAQYLQQGLGQSPFESGLALVPWVAAFGLAGQFVGRLPARLLPLAPVAGCVLMMLVYAAISAVLFAGLANEAVLVVLLALGGLGLGIEFSSVIGHLTNAVSDEYAPDISEVSTTTLLTGGTIGVAAFGTLYLSLTTDGQHGNTTSAFAVTTAAFAATALVAAITAFLATHSPTTDPQTPSQPVAHPD